MRDEDKKELTLNISRVERAIKLISLTRFCAGTKDDTDSRDVLATLRDIHERLTKQPSKYIVLKSSKSGIIGKRNVFNEGDTRTIRYCTGELKGRKVDQIFHGDNATGGWYDED